MGNERYYRRCADRGWRGDAVQGQTECATPWKILIPVVSCARMEVSYLHERESSKHQNTKRRTALAEHWLLELTGCVHAIGYSL